MEHTNPQIPSFSSRWVMRKLHRACVISSGSWKRVTGFLRRGQKRDLTLRKYPAKKAWWWKRVRYLRGSGKRWNRRKWHLQDFALIIPSARIFLNHLHFPNQSYMLIDTAAITLQKVSSVSICWMKSEWMNDQINVGPNTLSIKDCQEVEEFKEHHHSDPGLVTWVQSSHLVNFLWAMIALLLICSYHFP